MTDSAASSWLTAERWKRIDTNHTRFDLELRRLQSITRTDVTVTLPNQMLWIKYGCVMLQAMSAALRINKLSPVKVTAKWIHHAHTTVRIKLFIYFTTIKYSVQCVCWRIKWTCAVMQVINDPHFPSNLPCASEVSAVQKAENVSLIPLCPEKHGIWQQLRKCRWGWCVLMLL